MEEPTVNEELFGRVINCLSKSFDDDLFALSEEELKSHWYWDWDDQYSIPYNTYKFFDMLGLHKRSCERWETHYNGYVCVVERVRDKYLTPKIEEFLKILKEKQ
jgi:hypothetical protein